MLCRIKYVFIAVAVWIELLVGGIVKYADVY